MPRNKRPIPSNDDRAATYRRKTGHHAFHKRSPAGSKLLKAFYRAKRGTRPKNVTEARDWYAALAQPKYRQGYDPKRAYDALHALVALHQRRAAE